MPSLQNITINNNFTQRGTGLIEVLVALIILGVGMLGIASLYVTTLQAKTTATSRTQAVNLASDISDRIRANRTATIAYKYNVTGGTTPADNSCNDTHDTPAVTCIPALMAANDLLDWENLIDSTLPGDGSSTPSGSIAVDNSTTPVSYTITINWKEPTTDTLSYTLSVEI